MKAPALEKGLDVLEALVAETEALTLSQIAARTKRSVSEIQRMVHVLHRRGYLERTEANAYRPGLNLYELGRFRHPFQQLQTVAEPHMARLAEKTGHSIHLTVEDRGEMLILTEVLGSGVASLALKVGSRHPLSETLSGRILLTNHVNRDQTEDQRKLAETGYLQAASQLYCGVQDLGVPIRRSSDESILGVLACSWLRPKNEKPTVGSLVPELESTVQAIEKALSR